MTIADTIRHLGLSAPDPRSDGELLTEFVRSRDEPAFAELLRRHGPTVYGVCHRVVGPSDADDAFQAVFLVLARKAYTVRPPGMVGNWLYGVAVRTANKARVMNARKANRRCEPPGGLEQYPAVHTAGSPDRDTLAVIDAELAALPHQYRAAFVTCDLNGRSRSDAARELGWPEGTVAARLAKARELLAARLTKRGITLGVGLFAAVAVPTATATETLSAVRELLAVGTASAVAPAAQKLSDEVVKTMTTTHAKWLAAVGVLTLTLATGGAVLLAGPGQPPPVREPIKAPVPKETPGEWKEVKPIEPEDGQPVTGVACSSDGKYIAIAQAKRLEVLKADTRKRHFAIEFSEPATTTAVAFSPKGDKLAFTRKDDVLIRTLDVKDPGETWEHRGMDPHQVAWFADKEGGEHLLATNGITTYHRDAEGKPGGYAHWEELEHRPCVLTGVPGKAAWLMPYKNAEVKEASDVYSIFCQNESDPTYSHRLDGHKSRPTCAAVSADGERIVSGDEGGTVIVWEGDKHQEKRRIELGGAADEVLSGGIAQVALAPDGKTAAVVRTTHTVLQSEPPQYLTGLELFVIDVTDPPAKPKPLWKTEKELRGKFTGPISLAFSPNGKTLLAAFADPYPGDDKKDGEPKSMGVKVWELVPKK